MDSADPILYGYCHCGCGAKTSIAETTRPGFGHVKGEPLKWRIGHHNRGRKYPQRHVPIETLIRDHVVVEEDGCWIWNGKQKNTYSMVRREGRGVPAHVAVYRELVGDIPEGLELDHLCMRKPCVNPAHLEPVTHAENMRRYGASRELPTHCRSGHEYTPENTYVPIGRPSRRVCRECQRLKQAQYRKRRKDATG